MSDTPLKPCPFCGGEGGKQLRALEIALTTSRAVVVERNKQVAAQEIELTTLRAQVQQLEAERRWIPVTESLPDNARAVEVIDMRKLWEDSLMRGRTERQTEVWQWGNVGRVTHWRELPTPSQPNVPALEREGETG